MNAAEKSDELVAFVVDEILADTDPVHRTIMARRIERALRDAGFIPAPPCPADKPAPMTDEQAKHWGRLTTIPYGKFQGVTVDNAQLSYLDWLAEARDPFKDDLRRYLASARAKRERGE